MINIALDIMGGDAAPDINFDGAKEALGKLKNLRLYLVGPGKLISEKIYSWDEDKKNRIQIVNAPLVISAAEHPVQALLKKKDSSIATGARLVKSRKALAFVSAGSSGALLAAGQLIVGRIRGVERTPLAAMIPSLKGFSLFLDCGASVDAKPMWLKQYAQMGTIYMQKVFDRKDPIVKLINLGMEEDKGNELTKRAHQLLKATKGINYQGFIEARDVMKGDADIIVADAFTGNAIIKTIEGTTDVFMTVLKEVLGQDLSTKIGALLILNPIKNRMKAFEASEAGGAVLLGLDGCIVKCHGNAKAQDISIALEKTFLYLKEDVTNSIKNAINTQDID